MSGVKNNILIVDDDHELVTDISNFLIKNGFNVHANFTGHDIASDITQFQPDLILLDLMLPETDGLTICRQIRDSFDGVIIMLTALSDEIDEVTGLELGADDYLSKPVRPRVLLAHIRAQLRRVKQVKPIHTQTTNLPGLVLDSFKQSAFVQGETIYFTSAEFELLQLLADAKGEVVSREALHKAVYGFEYDGHDRSIDIRISRIRKKFAEALSDKPVIKTLRNRGYLLAM